MDSDPGLTIALHTLSDGTCRLHLSGPALAGLPLRVLLVLSEPVDASPTFSHQARRELLHERTGRPGTPYIFPW